MVRMPLCGAPPVMLLLLSALLLLLISMLDPPVCNLLPDPGRSGRCRDGRRGRCATPAHIRGRLARRRSKYAPIETPRRPAGQSNSGCRGIAGTCSKSAVWCAVLWCVKDLPARRRSRKRRAAPPIGLLPRDRGAGGLEQFAVHYDKIK